MADAKVRLRLSDFLEELDGYREPIPLELLEQRLGELEGVMEDVHPFVRFGADRYQRNLMHKGPAYHALILCWSSGQRSPIHDHQGSACGVRVLQGVATETLFERNPAGLVHPTTSLERHVGGVTGSFDSDIHQISNLQPPGEDLVTLHVYSPPLIVMNTHSLTDTHVSKFIDPIHEFSDGSGI